MATGAIGGAATLLVIAAGAPSFLTPLVASSIAVFTLATLVGAVVGTLAGLLARKDPARGAAIATTALFGFALGAAIAHRLDLGAPAWLVVAGGIAAGGLAAAVAAALVARSVAPRRALGAAAVLAVVAVGVHALASPAPAMSGSRRLVVVGLDGGTWSVIDPLLAEGAMPATARMLREGTRGVLWSMEPISSSVVWTTIATGKRPDGHGIHDFYGTQNDQLRAARFWEVASKAGDRVGIFQWLVTWPPDPLPGFVVPGWLARDARTQPESLRFVKELEVRLQRRERPPLGTALGIGVDAAASGLTFGSVVQIGRDVARAAATGEERGWYRAGKLMQLALHGDVFLERWRRERPRVAAVVFYGSDALSHAFWKFHDPADYPDVTPAELRTYGDTIREYYRRFDGFLGRLLDVVGPETTVLVVSDHGFHAALDHQLSVHTDALGELGGAGDAFTAQAINLQVYLTHRRPGTPEAAADVERVAATLRGLRAGGVRLLQVETTPGERVTAELRWDATHVPAATPVEGGARPMTLGALLARTTWSGSHDLAGILLARGPQIRPGQCCVDGSVVDVAPTVLTLLGYPVAADMDGHVLTGLFRTPPAVTTVASYDDAIPPRTPAGGVGADLHDRLQALGYVR